MIDVTHSLVQIAIMAILTYFLRGVAFLIFHKKTPKILLYFGDVLPYAIMGMLLVYCMKNVSILGGSHGIPELLAIALTAGLHKWKHNTLLSILTGTLAYMALVQYVF